METRTSDINSTQLLDLPTELLVHITKFLSLKENARLRGANKLFNHLCDPISQVWENYFENYLCSNPLLNIVKFTSQVDRQFSKLIKEYLINGLIAYEEKIIHSIELKFNMTNWLEKNPEMISILWEITNNPNQSHPFEDIRRRKTNRKYVWSDVLDEAIYEEELPTHEELFLLYLNDFRRAYELQDNSTLQKAAIFLEHLTAEFDAFKLENLMPLVRALDNPDRDKIQKSILQLNRMKLESEEDRKKFGHIKLSLIAKCIKKAYNIKIANENHNKTMESLLSTNLKNILSPYYPKVVIDKKTFNFNIWWVLKDIELQADLGKKLAKLGFKFRTGETKDGFIVQLNQVEPTEMILACEKYNADQVSITQLKRLK